MKINNSKIKKPALCEIKRRIVRKSAVIRYTKQNGSKNSPIKPENIMDSKFYYKNLKHLYLMIYKNSRKFFLKIQNKLNSLTYYKKKIADIFGNYTRQKIFWKNKNM